MSPIEQYEQGYEDAIQEAAESAATESRTLRGRIRELEPQVTSLSQQVEKARDALMRVEANTHDEGLRHIARDTLNAMEGE